jgi:rubredoxin
MIVNLKCEKCRFIYNFEVGKVSNDKNYNLVFENQTICPKCGAKGKDLLSELGQSQMTQWDLNNR